MNAPTVTYTTPTLSITPVRVSTMVTTAHVGTIIHLDRLFERVPIMPYWDLNNGILKMKFKDTMKGTSWKDIMQKTEAATTFFFNQATLVIRREVAPLAWKEINIKLFRNGGIQMTGVRSVEMSWDALRWLVDHILATCGEGIFEGPVNIHKMETQLVNTDFSIGAKIRRDALHKVLTEQYHLTVSYEPSIYQGVKTKFFYNAEKPAGCPPGLCPCEKLCKGTGDGTRLGACKKITISPFQTGQVIITGARTMAQINEAYDFMCALFVRHADEVLRKNYICPTVATGSGGTEEVAAPAAAAPPAAPTGKKASTAGWISHPAPRNIFRVTTEAIVGTPDCTVCG